jgi:hypothetical protein
MTDLTDFLDEAGDILVEPERSKLLAKYFTDIVFMASYPDMEYPPEYNVRWHCRPEKIPCFGKIVGYINSETDDIVWMCPKCIDRGLIRNWRGTMWDLSSAAVSH